MDMLATRTRNVVPEEFAFLPGAEKFLVADVCTCVWFDMAKLEGIMSYLSYSTVSVEKSRETRNVQSMSVQASKSLSH